MEASSLLAGQRDHPMDELLLEASEEGRRVPNGSGVGVLDLASAAEGDRSEEEGELLTERTPGHQRKELWRRSRALLVTLSVVALVSAVMVFLPRADPRESVRSDANVVQRSIEVLDDTGDTDHAEAEESSDTANGDDDDSDDDDDGEGSTNTTSSKNDPAAAAACWERFVITSVETRGEPQLAAYGAFPARVHNLGKNEPWKGFRTKVTLLNDFVFSQDVSDDDIVIFTDGDDVSFGGCPCDYLWDAYQNIVKASGKPIVFGSELVCWEQDCRQVPDVPAWAADLARRADLGDHLFEPYIDTEHCTTYPWDDKCIEQHTCGGEQDVDKHYKARCRDPQNRVASRYLNSGFLVGPVRELKPMLTWMLRHYDEVSWAGADQSVFAAWWLQNLDKATLDYSGQMVLTLNHLHVTSILEVPKTPMHAVMNMALGTQVCFYHYNGYAFPLGQAVAIKAAGTVPVTVVTTSTQGSPALNAVGNFPFPVINMGVDRHWHGYFSKVLTYYEYVKTRLADDQLLVFVDGNDVFWGGCDVDGFIQSFHRITEASHSPIVFGAEIVCGEQDCRQIPEVPKWAETMAGGVGLGDGRFWEPWTTYCGSPWYDSCAAVRRCENDQGPRHCADPQGHISVRYLNSGFVMGYGVDLLPMLEWVVDNYKKYSVDGRDQSVFASYWLAHKSMATLDYEGELVLTLANLKKDILRVRNHTVFNRAWNRSQCMYHGNGPWKSIGFQLALEASKTMDHMCSASGQDCSASLCCLDQDESCFVETSTTSVCKTKCVPGENSDCSFRAFGAAQAVDMSQCPTPPCHESW